MRGERLGLPVLAALVLATGGSGAEAQTVVDLRGACTAAGGDATSCAASALAGRDLMGHVGVLAGMGSDVPGEASTLGRRLGGTPRVALHVRGAGLSAGIPDLGDPTGTGRSAPFVPSVQAGVALGVFDGFRLLPTVGGVLSLDVIGQAGFLFFPESEGFDGRMGVISYGARVGVLTESFTLPGVSVSVLRRDAGDLRLGSTNAGDRAQVTVGPSITSLRATVGKDLFAVGVLAGFGWEDYGSPVPLAVATAAGGVATVSRELDASRTHVFVGASRQIGILAWVSAELGFVRDFDPVTALSSTVSQPHELGVFGSLAFLLKL